MEELKGLVSFLNRVAPLPAKKLPELYYPSNRLPIFDVLKSLLNPRIEPRQPHDDVNELLAESHIARAVFDKQVLPLLTDILSANRQTIGPAKKADRAETKVAGKLQIDQELIDSYKTSGKIHFGLNCDYTRSMQTVGMMGFIQRSSDIFQGRGIVTINKEGGSKPINIVILDVENGFIEEPSHKPNLMRINLKLAIPIELKDGTQTFHVLEHKILLKASLQNEKDGCVAWSELRALNERASQLGIAFDRAAADSDEALTLLNEFDRVSSLQDKSADRRAEINARDYRIKGIDALIGYTPESQSGSVRGLSWTFTPLKDVVAQLKAEQHQKSVPQVSHRNLV